jgi:hypothetical protein
VMSLYVTSLMGVAPLGGLMTGAAATHLGAPLTVALGGFACMVAAAFFGWRIPSLRLKIRPIYLQKGIVPTPGLSTAAEIAGRLK